MCLFVCLFKGRIAPLHDKSNPYLQCSPDLLIKIEENYCKNKYDISEMI